MALFAASNYFDLHSRRIWALISEMVHFHIMTLYQLEVIILVFDLIMPLVQLLVG